MHPELRSLIYKEWHERRLAFLICSGWICCCVIYIVAYEFAHHFRAPVAGFYSAIMTYELFGAVFLAMKTALGERTSKTSEFSHSLPNSLQRFAWIRLAGGVMTLVLPMILAAIIVTPFLWSGFLEQAPMRPSTNVYVSLPERGSLTAADAAGLLWTVTAIAIASGVELLLVLSVIGTRLRSESQIGFCGAVLGLGWTLLSGVRTQSAANGWFGAVFPSSFVINYGYGAVGGGSYSDLDIAQPLWAPLALNILVLLFLAMCFVRSYGIGFLGQYSVRSSIWRRWPAVGSRIPIQLPNRLAALVWINLRQSLPVAFFGLLLASMTTFLQFSGHDPSETFRTQLPSSTWVVATFWAVVVGTGIFAAEIRPGLSSFWRSRPLTVRAWYWCKFFIGLSAVLIVLDGVTILVSWGTPIGHTSGMSWSYIACMPIVHTTWYAVAVLGVCFLRHPVLGGILAIAAFVVSTTLVSSILGESFEPISVHNYLLTGEIKGQFNLASHNYPLVYGILLMVSVACASLASIAIRQPESPVLFSHRRNSESQT